MLNELDENQCFVVCKYKDRAMALVMKLNNANIDIKQETDIARTVLEGGVSPHVWIPTKTILRFTGECDEIVHAIETQHYDAITDEDFENIFS